MIDVTLFNYLLRVFYLDCHKKQSMKLFFWSIIFLFEYLSQLKRADLIEFAFLWQKLKMLKIYLHDRNKNYLK